MNKILLFFTAILTLSCVENYELPVEDQDQGLVVEASISDKSYYKTLDYPSEGRYFSAILRRTSRVSNIHDDYATGATVYVQDQTGNSWMYTEAEDAPGHYYLYDDSFEAIHNEAYQMVIILDTDDTVRSAWEQLPAPSTDIGKITFMEVEKQKYEYNADERVLHTLTGVEVSVDIPENESSVKRFYKWEFAPIWIYVAPYAVEGEMCWVTSDYYLNDVVLLEDAAGSYSKDLFFMETTGNERIFRYFSVLIIQQWIDESAYLFWKDLQKQNDVGGLFDEPPFSLLTNYTSSNSNLKVMGHFSVVAEGAIRWEFDPSKLSYPIINNLRKNCDDRLKIPQTPPPDCYSCLDYVWGDPTEAPPSWWNE